MSNPQNVRTVADSPEAAPGATTTFVRADPRPSAEGYADLHPQLRAQLRELQLRTGTATPDVGLLLRLVNEHYQRIETERRAIAESETVPEALQRLAASTGDTALDLAGRELWARRKDGESFPAEIAVSKAPLARREMFVLCLRNVTERRESEQAMRESAARYRL